MRRKEHDIGYLKILILMLGGSCALIGCSGSSTPTPTSTPHPSAGIISEFPLPTPNSGPALIKAGPDGNFWFTERVANQIGRISPHGAITEFRVLTPNSLPDVITAGSDGNLWFTEDTQPTRSGASRWEPDHANGTDSDIPTRDWQSIWKARRHTLPRLSRF